MNLSSVYSEIKQLLSVSDENFDLEQNINRYFDTEPEENKLEIIGDILHFVNNFSMFKDIKPFMNSLYTCITKTLEIKPDSVYDFEELLVKNAIMHFVQEHINYSNITQENQVLKYLTDSLEKLETQPLIMNLGILIKPMYQDQSYISNLSNTKEVDVSYNLTNGTEIQIKSEIDNWLKIQEINLDNQDDLQDKLKKEVDRLISNYNLSKASEMSKKLHLEAAEMLNMKLTMLSLMEQISDDSYEPITIK
ncbi:MAG: hypothetical protein ACFFG0_49305 [Candidatus Thorarchaeota archaeon]